eukprot:jgi/Botrbrau1/21578/Bobra.174_2s0073.1
MAITFFTLIALFMDDFRLAVLPPLLDPGCEVFAGAIVVVFALDLVFGSFTRDGYFLRTYFWIDMVATFSMLLDMPHFVASVTGTTVDNVNLPALQRTQPNGAVARARSITKVTRILRLLRVARLYQQYKAYSENIAFEETNGTLAHTSCSGAFKESTLVAHWSHSRPCGTKAAGPNFTAGDH